MADIRNVSNSVRPQEGTPRSRSVEQNTRADMRGAVDPTRTTKADNQTLDREADFLLSQNSNFENFISSLRSSPSAQETMSELLFYKSELLSQNALSGVSDPMLQELLEALKTDPTQLKDMLKTQLESGTKYKGALFDFLRSEMRSASSQELKYDIVNFLRIYDNYLSRDHLLHQLKSSLLKISDYLPKAEQQVLNPWLNSVSDHSSEEAFSVNRFILKQDIMPFLAKYVKDSRNLGALRELVTLFAYQLSKYDSSSEEQLRHSAEEMFLHKELLQKFEKNEISSLIQRLMEDAQNLRQQEGGIPKATEKMLQLISNGLGGEAGLDVKQQYLSLLHSLLVQQSVYMPFTHTFFPVNLDGKLMTSELWVDPEGSGDSYEEGEKASKTFIKFEIEGLGQFELILRSSSGKADMELSYPEKLEAFEQRIQEDMKEIGERNDLPFQTVMLQTLQQGKDLTEVFPKLKERRNTVNVKI